MYTVHTEVHVCVPLFASLQAPDVQTGVRNAWNTPPITPPSRASSSITSPPYGGSGSQQNYSQEVVGGGDVGDQYSATRRPPSGGRRTMAANLGNATKAARDGTFTLRWVWVLCVWVRAYSHCEVV